jgi:hypothetical protein
MHLFLLTIVLAFLLGASCAQSDNASSDESARGRLVTKADLGDQWPFTVESGYVDCPDGVSAIFRTADAVYGLNGMATSRGFAEPDPIRKADPTIPSGMISIGPMIDLAQQECK